MPPSHLAAGWLPDLIVCAALAAAGADAPAGESLTGLAGFVVRVVALLGAPGIGAMVALENVFPPVPSEVVLPLGGFLAGREQVALVAVLIWATAGSAGGALVLYAVGARFGESRVRAVVERLPLMGAGDVDRGRAWFDDHGDAAVLLGRLVPGVRSLVSLPAGVERMPLVRFLLLTTAGSLVWNSVLVGLGYVLGEQWTTVGRWSDALSTAIAALIVGSVALLLLRRARRRARSRRA